MRCFKFSKVNLSNPHKSILVSQELFPCCGSEENVREYFYHTSYRNIDKKYRNIDNTNRDKEFSERRKANISINCENSTSSAFVLLRQVLRMYAELLHSSPQTDPLFLSWLPNDFKSCSSAMFGVCEDGHKPLAVNKL